MVKRKPKNEHQQNCAFIKWLNEQSFVDIAFKYSHGNLKNRPSKSTLQPPGIPDMLGNLTNGKAFYIEGKLPGGRRGKAQVEFIEQRLRSHCIAFFAESEEDIKREFLKHGFEVKGSPKI